MTQDERQSVCVVIVNWNGGSLINECLTHLSKQTRMPDEVIIVDNASTDGSADALDLSSFAKAKVAKLDENVGFARANNIAAAQTTCDWLALLNPDTRAKPNWLQALEDAAQRHPDTSMFASVQIDAGRHDLLDGAGDCYFGAGIPWRGGFGSQVADCPPEGECFSPCGAAAFFRRDQFISAGGFEESYFCYCEDVDLGFRLRLQGERCLLAPNAIVYHHGSAITGRYSDFTVRLGTRNRLTTYLTNMPPLALLLTLPAHLMATFSLYLLALGQPKARSMRHGFWEGLKRLPSTLRRRRHVQAARSISSFDLAPMLCWNPMTLLRRGAHVRPLDRDDQNPG